MPGAFIFQDFATLLIITAIVVIMDIDMPEINGITLAKKILEIKPRTNIIYVTGYEKFALQS